MGGLCSMAGSGSASLRPSRRSAARRWRFRSRWRAPAPLRFARRAALRLVAGASVLDGGLRLRFASPVAPLCGSSLALRSPRPLCDLPGGEEGVEGGLVEDRDAE